MFIFKSPQNSLSFGNVSFGVLNSLYERNFEHFLIQDIGNPDISSFDKRRNDDNYINFLNSKRNGLLNRYSRDYPTFSIWHINGSEQSLSNKNILFTFHELDSLTDSEVNILNQQSHIIVSCDYSKEVFENFGVTSPISVIPLGFDSLHFQKKDNRKLPASVCSLTVMGKCEFRKHTIKTAQALIKKYAGNPKFIINLAIYNPFFSPEDNNKILHSVFQGKEKPFNFNILPYVQTVSEVNDTLNFTDILVDMSGAESFSLPSFNAACLGKHVIVHYNTGIKQWANQNNAVLVEPVKKLPLIDNIFFKQGGEFNQGNFYDYDEEDFSSKLDEVYKRWQEDKINHEGLKLPEKFSWKNSTEEILNIIKNYE